ncbi:hypothetical protein GJ700_27870 [Duganella sp. FT92W]|uniref:Uncharacterized protein n=1 Tax=Pseudoduganella rivuli TaxID=2666085 RepID=A0A7X2LVK2_9BURK|nr:hypothetical protein [Pseudoduganella rivuli]MRV75541.1 hypothetical protein [Pseudoduganella rivuli]
MGGEVFPELPSTAAAEAKGNEFPPRWRFHLARNEDASQPKRNRNAIDLKQKKRPHKAAISSLRLENFPMRWKISLCGTDQSR